VSAAFADCLVQFDAFFMGRAPGEQLAQPLDELAVVERQLPVAELVAPAADAASSRAVPLEPLRLRPRRCQLSRDS
jgi:hypothetical protein